MRESLRAGVIDSENGWTSRSRTTAESGRSRLLAVHRRRLENVARRRSAPRHVHGFFTVGLEATGHLMPGVPVLDEAPPGGSEPMTLLGPPEQPHDDAGKVGRIVGDHGVLAGLDRQPLRADR